MANLYVICSVLMACFFTISIYPHFIDTESLDWFMWVAVYIGAAIVNLMNLVDFVSSKNTESLGLIIQYAGLSSLNNVIQKGGFAEFLSMDMVKEKIGSFLVFICMIIQVSVAGEFKDSEKKLKKEVAPVNYNGMALVVSIGYGFYTIGLMYYYQDIALIFINRAIVT